MVHFDCWSSVLQARRSERGLSRGRNKCPSRNQGCNCRAQLKASSCALFCRQTLPATAMRQSKAGWWILPKVVNLLTIGCKSMHMETNREAENQLLQFKDIIATHKQRESPLADCKCYFNTLGVLNFLWPSAKWSFRFVTLNRVICCCCHPCSHSFFPSFTHLNKMSSWQIHQAIVPFIQHDLG